MSHLVVGASMEESSNTLEDEIAQWYLEISEAKKRDKDYIKDGERINAIYSCNDEKKVPFNILFSNTDTLIPALYSALPRPDVRRRFNDNDPGGKAAAQAGTRMLSYLIDTNIDGYETFDESMKAAVMDALLPGRGVTCVRYDAEITEYESEKSEDDTVTAETSQQLAKESELICLDSRPWDSVLFGYARKWSKVPWIAFEDHIDKQEAIKLFGEEKASKIKFTRNNDVNEKDEGKQDDAKDQGARKTATIYQIWDKDGGRKVRYVSLQYKDGYLKVDDDPLQLTGFYPIPKPIRLVEKANDLAVTAPYLLYESQAKELNAISRRILKLENQIQAKALYDAELSGDLESVFSEAEGVFVPAEKGALLAAEKGLNNAIWWMPIDQMSIVLKELYAAREACKSAIYEITGISDIIRGSSVASETATAQSIKSQWGTMRLKRNQMEVQRYARDLMRIMLEIAATNFDENTWARMTGLDYASEQDVAQAQQVMKMAQAFLSQTTPDGQPPQIPQQYQQIVQQAQDILAKPQWARVLTLLRDDIDRSYRIDIETNSTIMPDATEDKQQITEALQVLQSTFAELMPLVQQGIMDFDVAKEMVKGVIRINPFGTRFEEVIDKMKAPVPPQQPPDNSIQVKQMEIESKKYSDDINIRILEAKEQSENYREQMKLEAQRTIEQGKAATQMTIEQMRIESEQAIEEYRSQLDATVKLEIAKMQQSSTLLAASMGAAQTEEGDGINGLVEAINQGMAAMQEAHLATTEALNNNHAAGMMAIAEQLSRPKQVIRGEDGRVMGVQ